MVAGGGGRVTRAGDEDEVGILFGEAGGRLEGLDIGKGNLGLAGDDDGLAVAVDAGAIERIDVVGGDDVGRGEEDVAALAQR